VRREVHQKDSISSSSISYRCGKIGPCNSLLELYKHVEAVLPYEFRYDFNLFPNDDVISQLLVFLNTTTTTTTSSNDDDSSSRNNSNRRTKYFNIDHMFWDNLPLPAKSMDIFNISNNLMHGKLDDSVLGI